MAEKKKKHYRVLSADVDEPASLELVLNRMYKQGYRHISIQPIAGTHEEMIIFERIRK